MHIYKVVTPVVTDTTNKLPSLTIAEEAQKLQDLLMTQKELLLPEIFQASIAPFITKAEPAESTAPLSHIDTSAASSSSKRPLSFSILSISAKRRITPRSLPTPSAIPLRNSFAALAQIDNSDNPSPTKPNRPSPSSVQPSHSNSTPLHLTPPHSTPSQLNPTKPELSVPKILSLKLKLYDNWQITVRELKKLTKYPPVCNLVNSDLILIKCTSVCDYGIAFNFLKSENVELFTYQLPANKNRTLSLNIYPPT